MYKGQIPFDYDGNLLEYEHGVSHPTKKRIVDYGSGPREVAERVSPVWLDNYVFDDEMEVVGMSRGRSAANFQLTDSCGKSYNMFMTYMVDMLKRATINKGFIWGNWTFVKRGRNYGIKYV